MNDISLRRQLDRIDGDGPSPKFVGRLRDTLAGDAAERPAAVSIERSAPRRRPLEPLALAAAAIVLVVGMIVAIQAVRDDSAVAPASPAAAARIGDAWLRAIVDGNRDAFLALHGPDLEVDDTLMGFSEDVGILTDDRVGELYASGFDALQAAVAIDDDEITPLGCGPSGVAVRCIFSVTMIGTPQYRYTVVADLTVVGSLIRRIDFSTTTTPVNLRSMIDEFLATEATDDDRACLALGFNTVGCGEHESDFLRRYIAFYEGVPLAPGPTSASAAEPVHHHTSTTESIQRTPS